MQRELMTFRTEDELAENPDLMHSVEGVEDIRKWRLKIKVNVLCNFSRSKVLTRPSRL